MQGAPSLNLVRKEVNQMAKKYRILWQIRELEIEDADLPTVSKIIDVVDALIMLEFVRAGLDRPLTEAFNPMPEEDQ